MAWVGQKKAINYGTRISPQGRSPTGADEIKKSMMILTGKNQKDFVFPYSMSWCVIAWCSVAAVKQYMNHTINVKD